MKEKGALDRQINDYESLKGQVEDVETLLELAAEAGDDDLRQPGLAGSGQ